MNSISSVASLIKHSYGVENKISSLRCGYVSFFVIVILINSHEFWNSRETGVALISFVTSVQKSLGPYRVLKDHI